VEVTAECARLCPMGRKCQQK